MLMPLIQRLPAGTGRPDPARPRRRIARRRRKMRLAIV
jgi:hypothetical protein